jgi:site-specific recombinase XerD
MTTELVATSDGILAPLAEIESAANYAEEALAKNTKVTYASAWRKWAAFCADRDFDPYGPRGQIAIYLAWLADNGAKSSTVNIALCAICKAYETANLPSPREDRAVKLVYQGIRRKIGIAPEQVEAVLPHHLRAMVDFLPEPMDKHRLRTLRNRSLLTLGWVGGMRRSEIVALEVADVVEVPDGLRVTIRRSKTDQEGRGRAIGIPYGSRLETCPVRNFRAWIAASGITEGPVFRTVTPDGMGVRPWAITDRQLANIVAKCATRAGVEGRFAGHSLRAGLVTSAVRAGKQIKSIQAQTGHKTLEVLYRYVREQELFKDSPAAGLV